MVPSLWLNLAFLSLFAYYAAILRGHNPELVIAALNA